MRMYTYYGTCKIYEFHIYIIKQDQPVIYPAGKFSTFVLAYGPLHPHRLRLLPPLALEESTRKWVEENKYQSRTEQRINLERKLHAFTSGVDTQDKDASMPIIEENRNAHQNNS
jgi:hypothetical protein